MHPATLAVDNSRAPHYRRAPRGGCCSGGGRYASVRRVSGSEPLSLRTHRRRGRSRPLRSAVVEYQTPSCSSGLTPTLREDWSCKRALETPCHARIATSPQDPTAMSPDHWSNLTWDTVSAGAMTSRSNRLLGPVTRPCVQSESHRYSRHNQRVIVTHMK